MNSEPPHRLPRDTPVDTPAATPPSLIEPPVVLGPASASALANAPETIEAAYEAWDALRAELAELRATSAAERVRLEEQGALLLGAVKAASGSPTGPAGLVKASELERLAEEARRGWEASKAALEAGVADAEAAIARATDEVKAALRRRVEAQAKVAPPLLELMVRTLPGDRRILHLRRPTPDDAVLLLFAMSQRCPTRYGFLFDDSTEDALLAPPSLYSDDGVARVRPKPSELVVELTTRSWFWPLKGALVLLRPGLTMRWLSRGAVLEAEVADEDGFRNLLSREEAEQVTGALLSLKLAGSVELELVRG
ncbi:MAG: hypothetical protein SFW67_02460 [Myxococcaceae bacterium]|nr:hypothetical protein [Myxococcaceae bacterium]